MDAKYGLSGSSRILMVLIVRGSSVGALISAVPQKMLTSVSEHHEHSATMFETQTGTLELSSKAWGP